MATLVAKGVANIKRNRVFWRYKECTSPQKYNGYGHRWQRRHIPVLIRLSLKSL